MIKRFGFPLRKHWATMTDYQIQKLLTDKADSCLRNGVRQAVTFIFEFIDCADTITVFAVLTFWLKKYII